MSPDPSARPRAEPTPVMPLPGRDPAVPLPAPLSALIGRDRETAIALALVRDPAIRLVTLTGPGGVGKTRLALRVAAEVAGAFADGVVFVDLTPVRDPDLVMSAIAQALGVRRVDDRPALAALKDTLRHRETLLLLDNFEQVIDAGTTLSDLLQACPRLTALVTSRALLNLSGERVVPVPPLAVPGSDDREASARALLGYEAVRLFVERSEAVQPGFTLTPGNARTVAEMCARLDGLPLAIEMAAARSALFPPEALLARLDRRLPLLTGGPRDLPDRQRTMRDTIAWSYDLLDPAEQAVLRRLAVFVGGCDLDAAEAVCADAGDDGAFPARIESLVRQSLVQLAAAPGTGGMPRLTLLETVREFATEELAAHGEVVEAGRRHAGHALVIARRAEPVFWGDSPGAWRATIDAERGNLHAALGWAMTHEEPGIALRLASALVDADVLVVGHRLTGEEARQQLAAVRRALAMPGGDDASRITVLAKAAWLTEANGQPAASRALAHEAIALARDNGDALGGATARFVLGRAAFRAGDLDTARRELAGALETFLAVDAPGRAGWARCFLALLESHATTAPDVLDRAAERCDLALAHFRAVDYLPGIMRSLHTRASIASRRNDLPAALTHLRELLVLARQHHHLVHTALEDIASIAGRAGHPGIAARLHGAAREQRRQHGIEKPPVFRDEEARDLEAVRVALGEADFARELAEGQALPLEQAVAAALAFAASVVSAPSVTLTPREREVLPLLIEGRTAREIGEALYLSHRTVEHHIANIYARLGIRTRAELPDAARDAGLLAPPPGDLPA